MNRRWTDLSRAGVRLGIGVACVLTLAGLVPPAARRIRERWNGGIATLSVSERDARRVAFGRPYADGIEAIRSIVPERDSYVLVTDGVDLVDMAAYDLAPRRPLLLVPGMPSIERVRISLRGRSLPLWTVILKRGEPAPRLVRTTSVFGASTP